jgi:sugar phosphate isomerase/epimerase
MKTMKGPALFLAQFAGDAAPFNSLKSIAEWAASLGYIGIQIPTWDGRLFDLNKAAESKDYCDEIAGTCREAGVEITELSTHIQGQLVAVHPAYDALFDAFAVPAVRNNPQARTEWAIDQVKKGAIASRHFGLGAMVTFSGALAWPYVYPFPQRPPAWSRPRSENSAAAGARSSTLRGERTSTPATRSTPRKTSTTAPLRDVPGGGRQPTALRHQLRPVALPAAATRLPRFIDIYHERIKAFHVKDAEFNPDGRQGVYSGYQSWVKRAGRFRSLGDGQVDFAGIFSRLTSLRLRFLGGAGMGDALKASGGRRGRRRPLHPGPHHPGHRARLRRLRRRQDGRGGEPEDPGDRLGAG